MSSYVISVLVLCLGITACSHSTGNQIPVVRLPTQIKYSQDPRFYYVKPGDTLYSIAWHQDLDYRILATKNNIKAPYRIKPGQKLKIKFEHSVKNVQISGKTLNKKRKISTKPSNKGSVNRTKSRLPTGKNSSKITQNKKNLTKPVTKWSWPVIGRVIGSFSSKRGGNKGIDISTSKPRPVKAIASGRVVYSGQGLRGYGKLVIIKHNDDFLSAYAYNSKIRVKEKELIKVGQVIADTGNGGLHKNMLHLEIRFRGKPVNPLKYLSK